MVLLVSLLLVGVAVGGLLAVPVDVYFEASGDPTWKVLVRIEWLYGRVGRDIEPRASSRPKKKRSRPSLEQLDLLRQEPFWTRAKRLVHRSRRYVEVHEVQGKLRVGLGDPADTGVAFGLIQPLVSGLNALPHSNLRVAPDFATAGIFGKIAGGVRLLPLGLLVHGVAFVLSPEAIRTVRRLRSLGK